MPATFHFYLREDQINKDGFCSLYLRITHNRKLRFVNTGIKLQPSDWNKERELVRRSHKTYKKVNQELELIKEKAQEARRVLDADGKISADAIKKRLQNSSKDNFFTLADDYLKDIQSESFWTHKQTKVAIGKLKDFHGSGHLPLNLIDADFLTRFQTKLRKNNKPSTIIKNLGCIKKILQIAVRKHLIKSNPLESDNFTMVKSNGSDAKTKLPLDQVLAIENLKLEPGSNRWHSRNAFILSFYFCGMRFGDIATLQWSNVKNGRLTYDMNKTSNPIDIPIKDGAKRILSYYKGNKDDYIFPFLSDLSKDNRMDQAIIRKRISSWNSIVNGCLEKIAERLDIDESISMHVARHSFAFYGVNERNIPTYKMMMLLGHKNIKTTMQYLKSLDLKTVDNVMDEIF